MARQVAFRVVFGRSHPDLITTSPMSIDWRAPCQRTEWQVNIDYICLKTPDWTICTIHTPFGESSGVVSALNSQRANGKWKRALKLLLAKHSPLSVAMLLTLNWNSGRHILGWVSLGTTLFTLSKTRKQNIWMVPLFVVEEQCWWRDIRSISLVRKARAPRGATSIKLMSCFILLFYIHHVWKSCYGGCLGLCAERRLAWQNFMVPAFCPSSNPRTRNDNLAPQSPF